MRYTYKSLDKIGMEMTAFSWDDNIKIDFKKEKYEVVC
jgi:hypothetical protein